MEQINIFNIIKYVRQALISDKDLCQKLKGQVITIEGKENITYPFVTLTKTFGEDSTSNKDYISGNNVVVQIVVVTNKYQELCELAEQIYDVMSEKFNKVKSKVYLTDNAEDFDSDAGTYWEVLEYTFKL